MTSLILSAINTWLLYSLMVPSMESYSVLIFGKVEDTLQVERIVHVQMDPEQRLLVIHGIPSGKTALYSSSVHSLGCFVQSGVDVA